MNFSNFRPNEQTSSPDVHVQMATPLKLPPALVKAELLPSAGNLSVGPVVDSVSPSRATTDTVLPQSSKTLLTSGGFSFNLAISNVKKSFELVALNPSVRRWTYKSNCSRNTWDYYQ